MVKSSEWCVDCWIEPDANEQGREGGGKGEGERKEESSDGRGRGREMKGLVRRWTEYRGIMGRECWRDDVPQ